jgi:hypothetical protein
MTDRTDSATKHRADGALIGSIPTTTVIVGHLTNPDKISLPANLFYFLVAYLIMTLGIYAWSRTKKPDLEQT